MLNIESQSKNRFAALAQCATEDVRDSSSLILGLASGGGVALALYNMYTYTRAMGLAPRVLVSIYVTLSTCTYIIYTYDNHNNKVIMHDRTCCTYKVYKNIIIIIITNIRLKLSSSVNNNY